MFVCVCPGAELLIIHWLVMHLRMTDGPCSLYAVGPVCSLKAVLATRKLLCIRIRCVCACVCVLASSLLGILPKEL